MSEQSQNQQTTTETAPKEPVAKSMLSDGWNTLLNWLKPTYWYHLANTQLTHRGHWFWKHFEEVAGLVLIALCLLFTNVSSPWIEKERQQLESVYTDVTRSHTEQLHLNNLAITNQQYLIQVEQQAINDLLLLSEISVVLDVVESSQVGISFIADFNVTVGHAISELNKAIKRGLEINLASAAATKLIGLMARVAAHISPILLQATLWSGLFYLFLKLVNHYNPIPEEVRKSAYAVATRVLLLFVLLHLLLPYSIHLSAVTSHYLNAEIKADNRNKLANIHGSMVPDSATKKLKHKAEVSIQHLKKISTKSIHHKTESLFGYLLWTLTLTLFDLVIMPLGVLYGLYQVTKKMLADDC